MRRDLEAPSAKELVERWLMETRAVALALQDGNATYDGRRLGGVLHQAAALVELVRDGYAVDVHVAGRALAHPVRAAPSNL